MISGINKSRKVVVASFLMLGICIVSYRLCYLQVVNDDFLKFQGDKRAVRTQAINTYRGMILDRLGEPLAVSTPVQSVWVNPQRYDLSNRGILELANILETDPKALWTSIAENQNRHFMYLARRIHPEVAEEIKSLELPGVELEKEYRRFYPMGEVASHVTGITDIDQQGQEGIELQFDAQLTGTPGSLKFVKNRLGQQVDRVSDLIPAKLGEDIQLSIDSRLQYLAYKELLQTVKKHHAKSGTIVILDVDTFEVLAMVNVPSYNPNLPIELIDDSIRNRAVTDVFEPGSVMKTFSMVNVLSHSQYHPYSKINTSPGYLKLGNKTVKDYRNMGEIDIRTVIKKSSNVGISKLVLELPPENMYQTLETLGFGQRTDTGFPGEVSGHIVTQGFNNPFALATLAFGYGMAVTPLQLAKGYAIIGSGGISKPISLIKHQHPIQGERVIDQGVANAMTDMLFSTTELGGTAYNARVPGVNVAGKTGTVRKVSQGGYDKDKHRAIFAGFAPMEAPKLAIAIVIDEPQGRYYGGHVAAPLFSNVMGNALRIMNVPTHNLTKPEFILVKHNEP